MSRLSVQRRERQIVRILWLLKELAEGGRPSVRDLAARFGTRRETIYRDLRVLEDVGFPIVGDENGRLSRPRLARIPRSGVPEVRLTRQEASALLWAAGRQGTKHPFSGHLAAAAEKLKALAADGPAVSNETLGVVLHAERAVKDYRPHEQTVMSLVEAAITKRRCRVRYRSPQKPGSSRFLFEPYRLMTVRDDLYAIGKIVPHDNFATLAIERVDSLEITAESFEADPSFDPRRYEQEAFGVIWEKPVTVVVRFSADQAPYVAERAWHPSQELRLLKDGRLEMTFRAGGEFEILRWLLSWGDKAEVVRPKYLRRRMLNTLDKARLRYADDSTTR